MRARVLVAILTGAFLPCLASAGSFLIESNPNQNDNVIIHPFFYVGSGSAPEVTVCLDPSFPSADLVEPIVVESLEQWNLLVATKPNISSDMPTDLFSLKAVILHELGHCALGLGHTNLGFLQAIMDDPETWPGGHATISTSGENATFEPSPGADGDFGTSDDFRGDDVNRFWFHKTSNDPFSLPTTAYDTTTFSRDLNDLPGGHAYAANANWHFAAPNPDSNTPDVLPNEESMMNAFIYRGVEKRELQADDVETVFLALAGKDGVESTADDDLPRLAWGGTSTDTGTCEVIIQPTTDPAIGLGKCEVSSIFLANQGDLIHHRLAGNGVIAVQERPDWWYGADIFESGFETGDASEWNG